MYMYVRENLNLCEHVLSIEVFTKYFKYNILQWSHST